jgi:uncharacterized DUF497 family protein
LGSIQVEWDIAKAEGNLKKHGVCFDDAVLVFHDAGRVEAYDGREFYGEERWVTVGFVHALMLYVVYTIRCEDTIRLISARKASAHERERYREKNA